MENILPNYFSCISNPQKIHGYDKMCRKIWYIHNSIGIFMLRDFKPEKCFSLLSKCKNFEFLKIKLATGLV